MTSCTVFGASTRTTTVSAPASWRAGPKHRTTNSTATGVHLPVGVALQDLDGHRCTAVGEREPIDGALIVPCGPPVSDLTHQLGLGDAVAKVRSKVGAVRGV